jgi:hypothetical protein
LLNQLQALQITAPVALRERTGRGNGHQLARRLVAMRARPGADVQERTTLEVMRDLARRARQLDTQATHYRQQITELVGTLDATLLQEPGVGPISAAKLLACDPVRFPRFPGRFLGWCVWCPEAGRRSVGELVGRSRRTRSARAGQGVIPS